MAARTYCRCFDPPCKCHKLLFTHSSAVCEWLSPFPQFISDETTADSDATTAVASRRVAFVVSFRSEPSQRSLPDDLQLFLSVRPRPDPPQKVHPLSWPLRFHPALPRVRCLRVAITLTLSSDASKVEKDSRPFQLQNPTPCSHFTRVLFRAPFNLSSRFSRLAAAIVEHNARSRRCGTTDEFLRLATFAPLT